MLRQRVYWKSHITVKKPPKCRYALHKKRTNFPNGNSAIYQLERQKLMNNTIGFQKKTDQTTQHNHFSAPIHDTGTEQKQHAGRSKKALKIIPLGGLEEIGMNITAFEYDDSIIVVDCGMSFPDEETPGVDMIIPDVEYLQKNIEKVKGFFITHGHEDHIGALPHILKIINVPVYGTMLTVAIIENKLNSCGMLHKCRMHAVGFGSIVQAGDFRVEFIKTNHSIQDSAALAISCPMGTVVHTGDFKIDYTPVFGDVINLTRFAELGQKGVLAMLCDSTNAMKPGFTMSERTVGGILDELFAKYSGNRILISTFASNVDRVQQIINAAYKTGRKVAIDGRSMVTIIGIAVSLGYVTLPPNTVINISDIDSYKPEDTVIVMTGSQGEEMSSLTRIASGRHTKIQATPKDIVIFSSHPIPGNEKAVNDVINMFMSNGINVVSDDTHVSGHACKEDIKLLYSLVKPKYAVPVHGDFRQRTAQAEIAAMLGYDKEHIKIIRSGDVLEFSKDCAEVTDKVQTGSVMVDGNRIGNVGSVVISERKQLATEGIVIIGMTVMEYNGNIISGPNVICRGFVYIRNSQKIINDIHNTVESIVTKSLKKKNRLSAEEIRDRIKVELGDYLWQTIKARPMIVPMITEV